MKTLMRMMMAIGAIYFLAACSGGSKDNNNAAACYSNTGYYGSQTYYNPACGGGAYNGYGYGTGGSVSCQAQVCPAGMGWSCDKMQCLALQPCAGAQYQTQYGANPSFIYGLFQPLNTCWPVIVRSY